MSYTLITPPGRFQLPSARELWRSRDVFWRFGQRDLILRYRQTVLGIIWVVLQPLAAAGIFTVVFGRVAGLSSDGVPYFVFALTGMLAWNLFSGLISRSASALVSNQALVSKVFFPRLLVPLSATISVAVDFAVSLVLAIVLIVAYGISPGWGVVLLPVWVVTATLAGSGIGAVASALMVKYRDVTYVLPWLIQVLLYASPVAYAVSSVPTGYRWLYDLNPITWLLEAFRWSLLGSAAPPAWQLIALVIIAPVVFVLGTIAFQQMEREFADVI